MSSTDVTSIFQSFLDEGVANGVAPGFQLVIFDGDKFLFNGASGFASLPSQVNPEGKPFKSDTIGYLASCTKISISLIVLHLIERGLINSGFSINDLDSHEALVKILPEFKHDSGSLVTKIVEGFEDELGEDGRKVMKLKDAKGRVTLRMLLTHTAGLAYWFNHPHMSELYRPSDGSPPTFDFPMFSGKISDFEVPLVHEPGTIYQYGLAADWLGQFAVRGTGKNLRQLFKEILFDPLDVPPSEADIWLTPALDAAHADNHIRDSHGGFASSSFFVWSTEGMPPEGKAHHAGGCVHSSLQAYAKVLQAVLNQNPKILGPDIWKLAIKDDLENRGIKVPRPLWQMCMPDASFGIDEFARSTVENGTGVNLLQCHIAKAPTQSGRPEGSFAWAGLPNVYYFIDPVNRVGGLFGTQLFPFYDSRVIEMRDKLETMIYRAFVSA